MVKTNGGGTGIERAGVGANDALAEIGDLEAFVDEVVFDKLRHGPVEEHRAGFYVIAEQQFNLLACWRIANPQIVFTCGPQRIAQPAKYIAHGLPARHIIWCQRTHGGLAAFVVIPELDAGAIEKGNEEAVDGGSPLKTATGQVQFFNDERVEQAGEIGAGRHPHPREWLFDGARAADTHAALDHQHALTSLGEICGAGEPVVAGPDDDYVPGFGGQFSNWDWQADFA